VLCANHSRKHTGFLEPVYVLFVVRYHMYAESVYGKHRHTDLVSPSAWRCRFSVRVSFRGFSPAPPSFAFIALPDPNELGSTY